MTRGLLFNIFYFLIPVTSRLLYHIQNWANGAEVFYTETCYDHSFWCLPIYKIIAETEIIDKATSPFVECMGMKGVHACLV